jgi:exopolysaccharide production protein ExoQ
VHPGIAALVFAAGILGLFWLDRDPKARTSKALWIAVIWLSIAGSRSVGQWIGTLHGDTITDTTSAESMYTDGSPTDRLVYSVLLLAGLIVLATRRRRVFEVLRANWPLAAFFAYCAFSIMWSDYPDVAFKRWIKSLGDVVMVLIVLTDRDRYAAIKRVLTRTGFLLIPISVLFIKFYPALGRAYAQWFWTPYYIGVTTNKNELGRISLLFGLGFLWRFLNALRNPQHSARNRQLLAFAACLAMVFWLFWMAHSMTSLSCFLLAGSLLIVTSFRTVARRPWVVHLMVFAIFSVSITVLFLDMGSGVLSTMGRDPTLTGRTEIWKLVLGMTGNPLVGTGFESFWLGKRLEKMWSIYWWHPREAHDGYIEVFLNLGWLGIVMFGIVLVTGYRTVMNAFRRNAEEGKLRLAYLVAAVAYNFAESAFGPLSLTWIFFLLATFTVPGGWIKTQPRKAALATEITPPVSVLTSQLSPAFASGTDAVPH